jgi:hypothetical protein
MTQLSPVVSVTTDAIATCVWMIDQLNAKALAHPAVFAKLFERLRRQLRALPLDLSESCYFLSAADGCERLIRDDDLLAARWQLVQVVRKLRGYRDRWEGGPTLGLELAAPSGHKPEALAPSETRTVPSDGVALPPPGA